MSEVADVNELLISLLNTVLEKAYSASDAKDSDLVGLEIDHPLLDKPILIPFSCKKALNAEKIFVMIKRVLQTHKTLNFDEIYQLRLHKFKAQKARAG